MASILLNGQTLFAYIKVPDVIVLGSRLGGESARDVQIYTSSDFSDLLPVTHDSILTNFPSVYVRNRGAAGVQQDISISGSSFEQNLVLFDGIPFNDPQTGHFNMNIPMSTLLLERVELLNGSGAASHGASAMDGVINFISADSLSSDKLMLYSGSYQTYGLEYAASRNIAKLNNICSISIRNTGNYHPQTDSRLYNIFNKIHYENFSVGMAYMNKEYGAYDFYTPGWDMPSREYNELFMIYPSYVFIFDDLSIKTSLSWRRHIDEFTLIAEDPDYYKNEHINDVFENIIDLKYKNIIVGGQFRGEYIDSSSFAKHARSINSIYYEYNLKPLKNLFISIGGRYENIFIPRISAAFWPTKNIKLRTSSSKSYRRPTFTELYYNSPANIGNADLAPEQGNNYELGADIDLSARFSFSTGIFYKEFSETIDWVGDTSRGPWRSKNIGESEVQGINSYFNYLDRTIKIKLGHSFLETENRKDYFSKYALNYLEHKLNFQLSVNQILGLSFNIFSEYGIPKSSEYEDFAIINVIISKRLSSMEYFIKCENLTNISYSDYSFVPSPGRWFSFGLLW